MIVATTVEELAGVISGSCVTIGNFDGVHRGHQKLIRMTCDRARARGLSAVVVTFDPHPLRVLVGPETPPFITLTAQKIDLVGKLGPHAALVLPFSRAMAALTPEQFVKTYLVDGLHVKDLIIGYDYHMGKGRAGDYETLNALGKKYGFAVERIDPVSLGGAIVSSTRIRDLVQAGKVWEVRPLLSRFYQVAGTVVHGKGRGGKQLGFPTANLALDDELVPRLGVYAVWVGIDGDLHQGVANVGVNPTFGNNEISVEAHLLDFDRDLYGSFIRVHFVQRIRNERKFASLDELKNRIALDCDLARTILAEPAAHPKIDPGQDGDS